MGQNTQVLFGHHKGKYQRIDAQHQVGFVVGNFAQRQMRIVGDAKIGTTLPFKGFRVSKLFKKRNKFQNSRIFNKKTGMKARHCVG